MPILDVEKFLDVRVVPRAELPPNSAGDAAAADAGGAAGPSCDGAAALGTPKQQGRQYHVKWKGRSYLHCSWVDESDLNRAMAAFKAMGQQVG